MIDSTTKYAARCSRGVLWAFELPSSEGPPVLGTDGWLLPLSSKGTKEPIAANLNPNDWHRSLEKE